MLHTNIEKEFSIILGQCTYDVQKKLEANEDWPTIFSTQNALNFLPIIKLTTYKFDDEKYLPLFIHNTKSVYYQSGQGNMSLNVYRGYYMNNLAIATSYGSKLYDEALCDNLTHMEYGLIYKDLADTEKDKIDQKFHDQYISMGFLRQADKKRYGIGLANLENNYMKADTNYPLDMPCAFRFLDELELDKSVKESHERSSTHEAFIQARKL